MSITDQGPRSDAPTADVQGRVPALRSRLGTRGIVALVAGVAVVVRSTGDVRDCSECNDDIDDTDCGGCASLRNRRCLTRCLRRRAIVQPAAR